MFTCRICDETKLLSEKYPNSGRLCGPCRPAYLALLYRRNPARVAVRNETWRKANMPKVRARMAGYTPAYRADPVRAAAHRAHSRKWYAENKEAAHAAMRPVVASRRAKKANATPAWLTPEQHAEIRALYAEAAVRGLEVDHIVPIKHKGVCGLHVPWNLQLLTAPENRVKSNKLEPHNAVAGDAYRAAGGVWP